MAGLADLVGADPAWSDDQFKRVSGTNWEIPATVLDGNGKPVPWTGCTASAKLRRSNGAIVKTVTQDLVGGLQIDLSTAGLVVLRATPACTFEADDINRPLIFNLLVTSTSPSLVIPIFQRCFIVPLANLN